MCVGCLVIGYTVSAHNGGVNGFGCHTPGGSGSGNPCHCHPDGMRTPDLPCKDGQPVPEDEDEDEDEESSVVEEEDILDTFRGLLVEEEETCSAYTRDDYTYGPKLDVIKSKQLNGIYGVYEDLCFNSVKDVHIEHLVAIKEAHDSGMCKADAETKVRFANDLDNIVLASPDVNRLKSDHDATDWMPDHQKCWYAAQIIHVKSKYDLTIDEAEKAALQTTLDNCSFNDTELSVKPDCPLPE